nr:unnamed protein product [uncultured bacterium]
MKYTEEELLKLELHQRVMTINELLEGSSLKKLLLNDVAVSKGKLKQLLKPYEYNVDTKQFELLEITETSDNESGNELQSESQDNSVVELLYDIKTLMQISVNYQRECNEFMLQMISNKSTSIEQSDIRLYKTLSNDELITRSFKIYDSINERLKLATKSSDLNQQQLFNMLLDKALKEIGW